MQSISRQISPLPFLLIYSLLPGISKLLDSRIIFLANAPIILYIVARSKLVISVPTIVAGLYIFFSLAQTLVLILFGAGDATSALTASYMYLLPILGIYSATSWSAEEFLLAVLRVAVVHAVLGILLYNIIPLPGPLADAAFKLKEGVFQFRMASVSGSIVFGILMVAGLICACYFERKTGKPLYFGVVLLLYLCVILSQQRSAWGVSTLFMGWHFARSIKSIIKVGLVSVIAFLALNVLLGEQIPELGAFFDQRIAATLGQGGSDSGNIVTERSHMWTNAIAVFSQNPMGIGIGQGGWIAYTQDVNQEIVVTDGDYFHILLESGIYGLVCYALLISVIYRIFLVRQAPMHLKYLACIPVGATLQMVGSNLTELYFTNFLLWASIGLASKEYLVLIGRRSGGKIAAIVSYP